VTGSLYIMILREPALQVSSLLTFSGIAVLVAPVEVRIPFALTGPIELAIRPVSFIQILTISTVFIVVPIVPIAVAAIVKALVLPISIASLIEAILRTPYCWRKERSR
jgi:hypothetical protein